MKIIRAYKVELDPNNKQRGALVAHCGATRWVYNWALAQKIEAFKSNSGADAENKKKIPSAFTLGKTLTEFKKTDTAPWLNQYNADALSMVLDATDKAFQKYFDDCKSGRVDQVKSARKKKNPFRKPTPKQMEMLQHLACFPQFRKKRDGLSAPFRRRAITHTHIKFPAYIGDVKLKERGYLPEMKGEDCKTLTVSEKAGRWFASLQVEAFWHRPPRRFC